MRFSREDDEKEGEEDEETKRTSPEPSEPIGYMLEENTTFETHGDFDKNDGEDSDTEIERLLLTGESINPLIDTARFYSVSRCVCQFRDRRYRTRLPSFL